MPNLKIVHFERGKADFLKLLEENHIEFVERFPPPGGIQASGGVVEIIGQVALLAPSIATVLVAWQNARASRSAIVQSAHGVVVRTKGMSQEETESLFLTASIPTEITLVQTSKDDHA